MAECGECLHGTSSLHGLLNLFCDLLKERAGLVVIKFLRALIITYICPPIHILQTWEYILPGTRGYQYPAWTQIKNKNEKSANKKQKSNAEENRHTPLTITDDFQVSTSLNLQFISNHMTATLCLTSVFFH